MAFGMAAFCGRFVEAEDLYDTRVKHIIGGRAILWQQ